MEVALALAFAIEGLTVVTLIGTVVLLATFAFLFIAEKNMKQ